MGEIIKKLDSIKLNNIELSIEVNKPHSKNQMNSIHIQSDSFRLEMSEADFLLVALTTMEGIAKLKRLKKISNE